jgi:hypothetical protein
MHNTSFNLSSNFTYFNNAFTLAKSGWAMPAASSSAMSFKKMVFAVSVSDSENFLHWGIDC